MSLRVSMSARVERGLLGAHVLQRADELAVLRERRPLGQRLPGRLGHAEVDDLGDRLVVVAGHQHVRRLQIAMDDPLLVRVLHRVADRDEELQPLAQGQVVGIAILGDRHALDQLHDEVGPTALRRAGIEDLGDVRVVHHRQDLPFRFEPGDDPAAVHARLDDLQGDLAADGRICSAIQTVPMPALADLLEQLVAAGHQGAGTFDQGNTDQRLLPAVSSGNPGVPVGWSRMPWVLWWAASKRSTRSRRATSPAQASSRNACRSSANVRSKAAANSDSSTITPDSGSPRTPDLQVHARRRRP